MELTEILVQGVRGAPTAARWSFGPSVSVVPAGEREALLGAVVSDLLAPEAESTLGALALPNAAARAAITLVGRDQQRYRVVVDLNSGRRALQRYAGDRFETLTTTPAEIATALTAQVGLPAADVLRGIFFTATNDLPSQQREPQGAQTTDPARVRSGERSLPPGFDDDAPAASRSPPPGFDDRPAPPGFGSPGARFVGRPEAELRTRLAELAALLTDDTHARLQGLEFELDGLQKKLFDVDARLKPLLESDQLVHELEQKLVQYAGLDGLPVDFVERLSRFRAAQVEYERDIGRIEAEKERIQRESEKALAPTPKMKKSGSVTTIAGLLAIGDSTSNVDDEVSTSAARRRHLTPWQAAMSDARVRRGLIVGLSAIGVGVIGALVYPPLRWVAFVDIPAFGVAVWGALQVIGDLEEDASLRMRLRRLDQERIKLDAAFASERDLLNAVLQRTKVDLKELVDVEGMMKSRGQLLARLEEARAVLDSARSGGDVPALQEEKQQLQTQMRAVDEQLQLEGSSFRPDTADLTRERDEIEAILRGEVSAIPEVTPSASRPAEVASGPDVGKRLINLARDLLVLGLEDTIAAVQPRANQMLQVLTERRYNELGFSGRGEVSAVDAVAGSSIPFSRMPDGDKDLMALALKLAIIESAVRVGRAPVFFDRSLDVLPAQQDGLFVRMLQFLGQSTQVVCVTARRELAAAGTVVQAMSPPAAGQG